MMRLFVAVDLPQSHKYDLARLCCGVPGMKWVEPEDLHLTLRFLGEIDEEQAEQMDQALSTLSMPHFPIKLSGFGTFGRKHPEHLWVGLQPCAPLADLAGKIERIAQQSGLPAETRRYTPHVTLGRGRQLNPEHIQSFMLRHEPFHLPEWQAEDFHLFQSHLTRHGAKYQQLVSYPLVNAGLCPAPGGCKW